MFVYVKKRQVPFRLLGLFLFFNDASLCFGLEFTSTLFGIQVQRMPLRQKDSLSPWSFVSVPSVLTDTRAEDLFHQQANTHTVHKETMSNIEMISSNNNFLATQVWPSARAAAMAIEQFSHEFGSNILCEFGCGPGLPSLTALKCKGNWTKVIATDIDVFALELVRTAAKHQRAHTESCIEPPLTTETFDLTDVDASPPDANLYILADVFESGHVAKGAAIHVVNILLSNIMDDKTKKKVCHEKNNCVWIFAQSDRAQREVFLRELRFQFLSRGLNEVDLEKLSWTPLEKGPPKFAAELLKGSDSPLEHLWLCDVDELKVDY